MNSKCLFFVVGLVAQVNLALAAPAKSPTPAAELKALQGAWNVVETETQTHSAKPAVTTQWVFAGQKLYLRTGKKTVLQGIVSLNPAEKPKAINVVGKGAPPMLGIYQLSGHTLKVSAAPNARPTTFPSDATTVVSVLERAKTSHARHRGRALL